MSENKSDDSKQSQENASVSSTGAIVIRFKAEPSLRDAVKACIAWFDAENKNMGSFHDRMDLCKYSDWACRKAIGQDDVAEFKGVPKITFRTV